MKDTKREENEIIKTLLIKKKHWERKRDFYHVLYHRYERKSRFFFFFWLLLYLIHFSFRYNTNLTKNLWIIIIYFVFSFVNFAFYIYFLGYFWDCSRKLEKSLAKVSEINEKLIEIMLSSQITTNPTA